MRKIINLIYLFSIIGIQMFGNVSSLLPILENELIEKRNLISKEELIDSITIGRLRSWCSCY